MEAASISHSWGRAGAGLLAGVRGLGGGETGGGVPRMSTRWVGAARGSLRLFGAPSDSAKVGATLAFRAWVTVGVRLFLTVGVEPIVCGRSIEGC